MVLIIINYHDHSVPPIAWYGFWKKDFNITLKEVLEALKIIT
jgi:hypothetical protein